MAPGLATGGTIFAHTFGDDGSWARIKVGGNQATVIPPGSYGPGYQSAGDACSIEGLGTYATGVTTRYFGAKAE
ncbi:MAG: hypothetical protein FJ109_10245 [Deltaproteobacteria bacterium]|nr:hypothetical protein [Deltaproteobacteria bacterium]